MEVDPPVSAGDEADVESEGGIVRPKSPTEIPKDTKDAPNPEPEEANKRSAGVVNGSQTENSPPANGDQVDKDNNDDDENEDDDDELDGDEETYAVEKVL